MDILNEDPLPEEPRITINGTTISSGAAMTVRVTLESYATWLHENGLGDDETGQKICAHYLKQIQRLRYLMRAKLQSGDWILLLNDMRSANVENVRPVACAATREELEAFVEAQRVETYMDDGVWQKRFRKGGPFEWLNPPYGEAYVQYWPPDIPHVNTLT